VLRDFGQCATIFLVTGWVGDGLPRVGLDTPGGPPILGHGETMRAAREGRHDEAFLRWSEVEEMQAAGTFEFHSHTHTHTRWDQIEPINQLRRERLAADLAASRSELQSRLGAASPHLCWPQGYFDADYQDVASAAGFTHLFTTRPGTVDAATHSIDIPRIVVKDRPGKWLGGRLGIYSRPILARLYTALKGIGSAPR
jgi:peptidoglycan/xylan/chitin deacetylase (PgdA/CDA1 family)